MICPLVQGLLVPNWLLPTPLVILFSTAQLMALLNVGLLGISLNEASFEGAGLPAATHRKVTAWTRVQGLSGPNRLFPIPPVISFSTAQLMAFLNVELLGISLKAASFAPLGLPFEAQRKVMICARVQVSDGENVVALVPPVIPFSTAQSTGR